MEKRVGMDWEAVCFWTQHTQTGSGDVINICCCKSFCNGKAWRAKIVVNLQFEIMRNYV